MCTSILTSVLAGIKTQQMICAFSGYTWKTFYICSVSAKHYQNSFWSRFYSLEIHLVLPKNQNIRSLGNSLCSKRLKQVFGHKSDLSNTEIGPPRRPFSQTLNSCSKHHIENNLCSKLLSEILLNTSHIHFLHWTKFLGPSPTLNCELLYSLK